MELQSFLSIVNHIFLPPRLPQKGDDQGDDHTQTLCVTIHKSLEQYITQHISPLQSTLWNALLKMMGHLCDARPVSEHQLQRFVSTMWPGDLVLLLIHAQNAGVILRRFDNGDIVFEAFEASPSAGAVMGAEGKLLCSYPGPAITIPSAVAQDPAFQRELVLFLSDLNSTKIEDVLPMTKKAGSTVTEPRDTTHPRYITELLTGILRGLGHPADIRRIQKRVADDVQCPVPIYPGVDPPLADHSCGPPDLAI
ncbi:hypothetical protein BS47DRAFT_1402353 [Hydnum rufescens UP504]|uniref:DUF6606 domain-containing protein n=1 Tax=Hydnum rufescens UP504 TaxID=1448309 RepID=A0A9P6AE17_9AGAM|nr:hypothetical protein BS47DRAFT_1402353 [Hydnum rufescens UP504]